jgi:hypothetical protein
MDDLFLKKYKNAADIFSAYGDIWFTEYDDKFVLSWIYSQERRDYIFEKNVKKENGRYQWVKNHEGKFIHILELYRTPIRDVIGWNISLFENNYEGMVKVLGIDIV